MNNLNLSSLIIMNWNANSVVQKQPELVQYLIQHDVHILLLQETFIKPNLNFEMVGYRIYHNDQTKAE